MQPAKRIEIIASSVELARILDGLDRSGVVGRTVISNVSGQSSSGEMSDELTNNFYIIAFCSRDRVNLLVENIKPILDKFGGVCYLSDVMEVQSINCVAFV